MSESSSGSEGDNSLQICHIECEAEIDTETNNVPTPDARLDIDPLDPTFCATPTAVLTSHGSLDTDEYLHDQSTTLDSSNVDDSNEPLTLDSSSYDEPLNTEALPDG